jgi:hypothetical protein
MVGQAAAGKFIYTPTSASWINQIERFFPLLTERALKRGVCRSVAELEAAVKACIGAFSRNGMQAATRCTKRRAACRSG